MMNTEVTPTPIRSSAKSLRERVLDAGQDGSPWNWEDAVAIAAQLSRLSDVEAELLALRRAAPAPQPPPPGLTFGQLRKANVERCEAVFHPLNAWSPTDWACAAAGELGEACNLLKKRLRAASRCKGAKITDPCITVADVACEIADTIIYLDLLAARLRIDLGQEVREKFNLVSDEMNCDFLL